MSKTGSFKIGRNAINGQFIPASPSRALTSPKKTVVESIKSSKPLRAQKTVSQKIDEDIKRNIDVYKRLRDR
jgi:hypothetical protein